jgi:hypothetical protein
VTVIPNDEFNSSGSAPALTVKREPAAIGYDRVSAGKPSRRNCTVAVLAVCPGFASSR